VGIAHQYHRQKSRVGTAHQYHCCRPRHV